MNKRHGTALVTRHPERQHRVSPPNRPREQFWWRGGGGGGEGGGMPGGGGTARPALRLEIRYGSETGNARDAAERCGRRARARGLPARVAPLVPGALSGAAGGLPVVLFVSTTGQGECPQAARAFWRDLLRRNLAADHLAGTRFCVFGLGDSGYPSFNVMALKLERRLQQLGAERFVQTGLGDDQHPVGYSGALEPWLAGLWRALLHRAGAPVRAGPERGTAALEPPRLRVELRSPSGHGGGAGRSPRKRPRGPHTHSTLQRRAATTRTRRHEIQTRRRRTDSGAAFIAGVHSWAPCEGTTG